VKILLFGAAGVIGNAIALEAIQRGHTVTGACPSGLIPDGAEGMSVVAGDATDPASVARFAPGHDAVASAVGARRVAEDEAGVVLSAAPALVQGLRQAAVYRLVIVGNAGSLFVAPGERWMTRRTSPWSPGRSRWVRQCITAAY
jgi:putative NADH-flavin reductase